MASGPDLSQLPFSEPEKGRFDDSYEKQPNAPHGSILRPTYKGEKTSFEARVGRDPSGAHGLTTLTRNGQMLRTGRFYDRPTEVKKQVLRPAWVGTLRGLTV